MLCFMSGLLMCALLMAVDGDPLGPARDAFKKGLFQEVVPLLTTARAEPLTDEQRFESWELEALTYAAFDDALQCKEAFRRAVAIDPSFQGREDWSPKVRALFLEARQKPSLTPAPLLSPTPLVRTDPAAPVAVVTPEKAPVAWYGQWWVWTLAGVVVAGAVTATAIAVQPRPPCGTAGCSALQP
jgi:hypothetical protein